MTVQRIWSLKVIRRRQNLMINATADLRLTWRLGQGAAVGRSRSTLLPKPWLVPPVSLHIEPCISSIILTHKGHPLHDIRHDAIVEPSEVDVLRATV